jgi:predicted enzyme related to lactoylglutathione lyase
MAQDKVFKRPSLPRGRGGRLSFLYPADVAKAKELGATVVAGPTQVGDMLMCAVVADPAGATFALLKGLKPGPQA